MSREVLDWAEVTDRQLVEGGKGLQARIRVWIEINTRMGRTVTMRYDFETGITRYEATLPSGDATVGVQLR